MGIDIFDAVIGKPVAQRFNTMIGTEFTFVFLVLLKPVVGTEPSVAQPNGISAEIVPAVSHTSYRLPAQGYSHCNQRTEEQACYDAGPKRMDQSHPLSSGAMLLYFVLERGSAIIDSTVSRHTA